ncbi:MAG: Holliday junction resolvase RuvX [Phycisphaerales bacterium]|nr:MAG: Holliday junction resolvase RuvX [Phycisphaerales bacterium]
MRYLAIDHGGKRTGLAICDAGELMASPLCVLQGQKNVIAEIAQIIENEQVGAVVLGLPLNMDGSEGPQARLVKAFAEQLRQQVHVPVHLHDERLSRFGARERLESMELSKGKKRGLVDAVAAAEILESFLEQKGG